MSLLERMLNLIIRNYFKKRKGKRDIESWVLREELKQAGKLHEGDMKNEE